MFTQLIASKPPKGKGFWGVGNVSISLIVHAFLLGGLVFVTGQEIIENERAEEEVTFVEVEEPPPPPEPPPADDMPPPPQGFQELIPPIEPPSFIPDISESLAPVNLADFSGIGAPAGIANVAPIVEEPVNTDPGFAYQVEELDELPRLVNATEASRALTRFYPRLLLQAGISGTTMLRFVIQPDGSVDMSSIVVVSTSNEDFASASRQAVQTFRFQPGIFRGEAVRTLIQMPINWQANS